MSTLPRMLPYVMLKKTFEMWTGKKHCKKLLSMSSLKYYLIHEKECFIIFKTRGAAERFRYDKTRLFECIK